MISIFFSGQCIGLILADSSEIAHQAVDLVKITYKNKQPLITNIHDGIKSPDRVIKDFPEFFGMQTKAVQMGDPKEKDRDDLIKIEGEFELGNFIFSFNLLYNLPEKIRTKISTNSSYFKKGFTEQTRLVGR